MSQKNNNELFIESVFKVARLIFNYPNKVFHLRMLERETKLSTTGVRDAVEKLRQFGIIRTEKTPITTNIKANLGAREYHFYKRVFDLYRLKRCLIIDKIAENYGNPEAIVIFGSFARGEDIEESDIDILIVTPNKADPEKLMKMAEKEFNRKINIHALQSLDKSEAEFRNAAANGIVLHGYLKVL